MRKLPILIILPLLIFSCKTSSTNEEGFADSTATADDGGVFVEYNNPPAEGFNLEGSDMIAMLLADKCMIAMGGREAWDNTRYISWNFFGRRDHLWDKSTGDVRIEDPSNGITMLMNIKDRQGQVFKNGALVSDSSDYFLQKGYEWWVNDSYWLVMPYKLKDSGVTLKYLREDTTMTGSAADVIYMSFDSVGVTPQNVYEVWVDTDSKLVTQWAYYPDSSAVEPRFVTPWADYEKYGNIMLSGDRGNYGLENIAVLEEVPNNIFENYDVPIASLR